MSSLVVDSVGAGRKRNAHYRRQEKWLERGHWRGDSTGRWDLNEHAQTSRWNLPWAVEAHSREHIWSYGLNIVSRSQKDIANVEIYPADSHQFHDTSLSITSEDPCSGLTLEGYDSCRWQPGESSVVARPWLCEHLPKGKITSWRHESIVWQWSHQHPTLEH